jgi:uncharacterized SAM-dependent methyltransferase
VDLVKGKKVLEAAYNDSRGVTRDFNLNLLRRINYELRGDLDYDNFEHIAFYNSKEKRIEMHIRSKTKHQVSIQDIGLSVDLEKGETIRTEYSHKYTISQIGKMAKKAGLSPVKIWRDEKNYFALVLFSV